MNSARTRLNSESEPTKLLLICRDLKWLPWLTRNAAHLGGCCVVASDDPRVHDKVRHLANIREAVFLERSEAFYCVADEVMAMLSRINQWLRESSSKEGVPAALLYWTQHCEGGDTTQRIQDALLFVRSWFGLIERFRPEEVIVVGLPSSLWEDDLLRDCATSVGIHIRFVGRPRFREGMQRLWEKWRPLAKEVVFSLRTIFVTLRNSVRRFDPICASRAVVVQLCDAAKKHFNHTQPLVKALDNVGLQGVALCWGAGESANILRRDGATVVELESWVGMTTLVGSWGRAVKSWRHARTRADTFLTEETIGAQSRLLRGVLLKSIRAFFLGEVAHRYRLDVACRQFFTKCPPRAARLWTRILPPGVIAYRSLPSGCRPMLFWQPGWPYQVLSPYTHYDVPVDLVFAISQEHCNALLQQGIGAEQMAVVGMPWLAKIREFKQAFSKDESRKRLGISESAEFCVLCDAGYIARGYLAPSEQAQMVAAVIGIAQEHPNFQLIIKPHQGHKSGWLDSHVFEARLPNLTFVPRTELPYHALNAADVLVTKYSTLALEGMILGVPSIAVLLDGERRFACYEDSVAYVWQADELRQLLVKLLKEPDFRSEWTSIFRTRSNRYLERHCPNPVVETNELIARTLKERLLCSS